MNGYIYLHSFVQFFSPSKQTDVFFSASSTPAKKHTLSFKTWKYAVSKFTVRLNVFYGSVIWKQKYVRARNDSKRFVHSKQYRRQKAETHRRKKNFHWSRLKAENPLKNIVLFSLYFYTFFLFFLLPSNRSFFRVANIKYLTTKMFGNEKPLAKMLILWFIEM